MTRAPDQTATPVAQAEGKLARLGAQVEAMQALLVRLLQDVVRAETQIEQGQVARLVQVNEQLVVAALSSQDEADTAAMALDEAEQSAVLDALTRLPNRTALFDRGRQAIANARRRGSRLAVLFLDLDNFKDVNDAHGHAFGDQVLCLTADHMRSVVREADTVSRLGGDEFVVLLAELHHLADAQAVAEKLIAAMAAPVVLDGKTVSVTASVGIAIYPQDGTDVETLVARADAAMYETKRQRAGGIALHGSGAVDTPGPPASPRLPPAHLAAKSTRDLADADRRLAQLRDANEKLVLAAITAQELKEAAELARQRQTVFMAAVVDELRNPMAPIRIASAMLGREPAEEPLLPRVQGLVEQQMARMSHLVGNLIEASTASPGGWEFERHWVDLTRVIDAAIATHRPQMQARAQHFESHRPPGALGVLGDAARLELVVSNLLDNASKHTHDGGSIRLSVEVAGDTLTLTVSDNGIGITSHLLLQLFEPFVQDAHTLGLNGVGLGIGLTVARALVRAHGGDLVAHSAGPRRGSQFVVTLPPAASAERAPAVANTAGDAGAGRSAT
ncbi:MAG: diguanylate cyclase [Rubrivivax sp.]|nr:diguanylate cyclase [Rubrivivax sp.]